MGSVIGYQEAHGPVATFETDVAGKIKSLVVDINPVQEGSGDPSPENVRPITGWTGAKVTKCGKNLLDYRYEDIRTNQPDLSRAEKIRVAIPATCTFSFTASSDYANSNNYWLVYIAKGTARTYITPVVGTTVSKTISATPDDPITEIYVRSSGVTAGRVTNLQLELGSTATAYEPYVGSTYDITFPSAAGTVYGGKLDIISGELIVDKAIVDLGTLDWSKSNLTYFKSDSLKSVIEVPVGQKTPADMVCSKYATLSYSQVYAGSVSGIAVIGDTSANDKGLLTINDLALVDSTAEDFKASLSGTMLAYKVKSPVSYTLTPQEIQTIIGTNIIYADTGDVSVLYPKTLTPEETVSNVNLMELRRGIIASQPHLETKSGGIVSFKSTMAREPENLVVDIEPVQEGTGDPSPDNVRPITGWTGAKVVHSNKAPNAERIFEITLIQEGSGDPSSTNIRPIRPGLSFERDNGTTLDVYGGTLDMVKGELVVDRVMVTFDGHSTSSEVGINIGASCNRIVYSTYVNVGIIPTTERGFISNTFATHTNYGNILDEAWQIYSSNTAPRMWMTVPNSISNLSDWNAYTASNPVTVVYPLATPITYQLTSQEIERAVLALDIDLTVYDITFPSEAGTVYGGKLDLVKGELVVDRAMVDLGTLSDWTYNDTMYSYGFFTANMSDRKIGSLKLTCSKYATASGGRNTMINNCMIATFNATSSKAICIRDDAYTNPSEFATSLSDVQLVYELASPITYQLTPQEITLLRGNNTIFADCGDTTISYFTN